MKAYYNEIEPYAVQWLRNLIDAGEISLGIVDDRSILDVTPKDLDRYDRSHFFAGIGGWDYALRLAGWSEEWPVWTGSCPCQPFSTAGQGAKGTDERHLWPYWFHLIRVCRPTIIFGEQVASKDGLKWLDLVCSDLEAEGYSCGAADLCAAGVGAPHIRQRLWFMATLGEDPSCFGRRGRGNGDQAGEQGALQTQGLGPTGKLADSGAEGLPEQRGLRGIPPEAPDRIQGEALERNGASDANPWYPLTWLSCRDGKLRPTGVVGYTQEERCKGTGQSKRRKQNGESSSRPGFIAYGGMDKYHPHTNYQNPARDEQWPTQSIIQPLAHGISARVGRLRAYGNAIVPQVAAVFIKAVMEILCYT